MKAYFVTDKEKEDNYGSFVWAETANKSKTSASDVASESDRYIDLRAVRVPFADDMEHLSQGALTTLALENDMSYYDYFVDETKTTVYLDEDDLEGIYYFGFDNYLVEKSNKGGSMYYKKDRWVDRY